MSLNGNLEDLPLLDILQIVSFSKKTGYLAIHTSQGAGAIVFRDGLVVSSFTWNALPLDPRFPSLPKEKRDAIIRTRIEIALEQLIRLRDGRFSFSLTEEPPRVIAEHDISPETLTAGINPQELLLDLARGMDEDRRDSAAAVEASFAQPEDVEVVEEDEIAPEYGTLPPGQPVEDETALFSGLPGAATATAPPAAAPAGPRLAPIAGATVPLTVVPPPADPTTPPLGIPQFRPPAPAPPKAPAPTPVPSPPPPASAPQARTQPIAGARRTLLLVDDEEDVRQVLASRFTESGYEVIQAEDPEAGVKTASRLAKAGVPFLLVTDLGMPTSGGSSFQGGFEVVKRLSKMNLRPPVLMMAESLNPSLQLRAKQMGISSFVFKPGLSKLNPKQFEADLHAFAAKVVRDILPRLGDAPAAPRPGKPQPASAPAAERLPATAEELSRQFTILQRRLSELRGPTDANQISVLVMKVAREFFERAILFLVKNDEVRGLGGFGSAPKGQVINLLVREVVIPLSEPSLFEDAVAGARSYAGPLPEGKWSAHLMGKIGRFASNGVALLPLVTHRETIAVLFGDNPESGREFGRLDALEVFVNQAGVALERVFLQRKLQALSGRP